MANIAEYRTYLWHYLQNHHNLKNPKQPFQCLNPEHPDNNPSMSFTSKFNICKCFACGAKYDIFDLIGLDYNINNFRDQLLKLQEMYEGYVPTNYVKYEENNKVYDYTNYFNKCIKKISNINYLQERGIPEELIFKYKVGYDDVRNLVVFPINKHCYFGRSTVNKDKVKSPGKSDIWNVEHLINSDENSLIYVTESIIDALSLEVIDPEIKVVSINGITNNNNFIYELKKMNFNGNIIITFDNDYRGIKASKELKQELDDIGITSFSNTLISSFGADECTDLNQALLIDKDKLKRNYEYANKYYKEYVENKNIKESEGICYD